MTVKDSSGIRVIESSRPAWEEGDSWQVSPDPILSLGGPDGDPTVSFHRLAGVYIVGSNRLAVLDGGANEIRLFNLNGGHLFSFGGSGHGPGEFRDVTYLGFLSDSLWVFDRRQLRVTVLDTNTSGYRVIRLDSGIPALGPVATLRDGSTLFTAELPVSPASADEMPRGLQRLDAAYVRFDRVGKFIDTVMVAPGSERILRYGPQTVEFLRPLLAKSVSHAVRGGEILQGTQETYEIEVHAEDGTLRSVIRRSGFDVGVDEASYDALVEQRILSAPEPARRGLRTLYQELPKPETRPAYSRFLVDVDGLLWIQDFAYSGDARSWSVFDPEGVWLGVVEFPDGFRPTQILRDRVVGVGRDELDVQYAQVYGLTRG
jgi:hypothetical protein